MTQEDDPLKLQKTKDEFMNCFKISKNMGTSFGLTKFLKWGPVRSTDTKRPCEDGRPPAGYVYCVGLSLSPTPPFPLLLFLYHLPVPPSPTSLSSSYQIQKLIDNATINILLICFFKSRPW